MVSSNPYDHKLGKPFILTDFNSELKDLNSNFLIAKNQTQFSKLILDQIKNPTNNEQLKIFASNYEWKKISFKYRATILDVLEK